MAHFENFEQEEARNLTAELGSVALQAATMPDAEPISRLVRLFHSLSGALEVLGESEHRNLHRYF